MTGKKFLIIIDTIITPLLLLVAGIVGLIFSVFGKLPDPNSLIKINGTIKQCHIQSHQRGIYHAFFILNEYDNSFEDSYFSQKSIDSIIRLGDTYSFNIRKLDSIKLNTGSNILTWSTNINGKDYETTKQKIEIQKAGKYIFLPFVSCFLIVLAFFIRANYLKKYGTN